MNTAGKNPTAMLIAGLRGATILTPTAMVDSMNPGGITGLASIAAGAGAGAGAGAAPAHG